MFSNLRLALVILGGLAAHALTLAATTTDPLAEARRLLDSGQWTKAHAAYTALATADPALAEAQRALGLIALHRKEPATAVAHLECACALEPQSSDNARLLGDAYGLAATKAGLLSKLGWARKCKAACERAVALDPTNVEARWALMQYLLQAPGLAGGSFALAHEQAAAILPLDPGTGRFAQANVFAAEGKIEAAFAPYASLLTAEPADYTALHQFGQLCLLTGKRGPEGLAALQKCLTMTPPRQAANHVTVHWMIGRLHEARGDPPAARAAYQAALALDAYFPPALAALAKLP